MFRLDHKDRLIFEALQENPDLTQQEISTITGLSQPAVGSKVKRMRELRIIDHAYGIDIRNAGPYVLKVEVRSSNPKDLIKTFEDCPFFLNGFIVTSEMNVTLMFTCDQPALDGIVDNHIKSRRDVHEVDVGVILSTERKICVPIKASLTSNKTPSCGSPCHKCEYCFNGLCPGCPLTRFSSPIRTLRKTLKN
ncbi:MAG: Lrp/AsnC family transcriptional regulator [Archaeoglobaceae archaeon]